MWYITSVSRHSDEHSWEVMMIVATEGRGLRGHSEFSNLDTNQTIQTKAAKNLYCLSCKQFPYVRKQTRGSLDTMIANTDF